MKHIWGYRVAQGESSPAPPNNPTQSRVVVSLVKMDKALVTEATQISLTAAKAEVARVAGTCAE